MPDAKQKTCGEYYRETMAEFCGSEAELTAFTAGVIYGQAEKVFLGACPAAMFRPREENFAAALDIVQRIASARFGLHTRVVEYQDGATVAAVSSGQNITSEGEGAEKATLAGHKVREIWIYKPREGYRWGRWIRDPVNSPIWHKRRAADCGIPDADVDHFFHERDGYAAVCDEVLSKGA